jgi:hypothetical protein
MVRLVLTLEAQNFVRDFSDYRRHHLNTQ